MRKDEEIALLTKRFKNYFNIKKGERNFFKKVRKNVVRERKGIIIIKKI